MKKFLKSKAFDAVMVLLVLAISSPAFAQFAAANRALSQIQSWLLGAAAVIFSICASFIGFRMMAGGAQWKDVAPVFWGGVIVSGAAAFSALFF